MKESDFKEMLDIYRQIYGYSYSVNGNDFLFVSRKNQAVTNISWGRIIKDSADAVGIKKNINSESIRKTYGLNIYKTSKNKIKAIQFLGEIWGQQREAQIIKYLNLVKNDVDFDFFFGDKFSLYEIDLNKIVFVNNYGYISYENGKQRIKTIYEKLQTENLISKSEQKAINKPKKTSTTQKMSSNKVLQNKNYNTTK